MIVLPVTMETYHQNTFIVKWWNFKDETILIWWHHCCPPYVWHYGLVGFLQHILKVGGGILKESFGCRLCLKDASQMPNFLMSWSELWISDGENKFSMILDCINPPTKWYFENYGKLSGVTQYWGEIRGHLKSKNCPWNSWDFWSTYCSGQTDGSDLLS